MTNFFNYIYDFNLLIIIVLGFGLCLYKPSKLKNILFLSLTCGFMLFIFTSRYDIGFDYFNYYVLFSACKNLSFMDILTCKGPAEPGFCLILKLIYFITQDIVIMYLILGIIAFSMLGLYVYKYSPSPFISIYLFVTFGFMFGLMNLFRQYFAAIISLFAIRFIKEKKFLPFLLITLLAASIHKSALFILPIYFVARLNITWKSLTFYGALTLLSYIFCDYAINFITQYVYTAYNLKTGELSQFMAGMPWKFVFVPFVYCLTAILMKNKLIKRDPGNIVLINFSIYTLMFWILMTRHLLIERPSNYFYISSILLGAEVIAYLNPNEFLQSKISELKQSISQIRKNNGNNKVLEQKNYELRKIQDNLSEAKSYYITAIVAILALGFLNQIFAMSHGNHNVFPYHSIFTEPRDIEKENKIIQHGYDLDE